VMLRASKKPKFFITTPKGLMNQMLRVYLKERFGVDLESWPRTKTKVCTADTVFHNATQPWKHGRSRPKRLILFKSDWNSADRAFWGKAGATHFISLSDPISEINKIVKNILKTIG
jgi:hypothetical protein